MVLISLKHSEGDGFLYETTIITPNSDLISSLVTVYNDRLRSKILIEAVRDLANYGPMKNSECTGLALAEVRSFLSMVGWVFLIKMCEMNRYRI